MTCPASGARSPQRTTSRQCVCVCVCAGVRACVRARVWGVWIRVGVGGRAGMWVCVGACASVGGCVDARARAGNRLCVRVWAICRCVCVLVCFKRTSVMDSKERDREILRYSLTVTQPHALLILNISPSEVSIVGPLKMGLSHYSPAVSQHYSRTRSETNTLANSNVLFSHSTTLSSLLTQPLRGLNRAAQDGALSLPLSRGLSVSSARSRSAPHRAQCAHGRAPNNG